MEVRKKANIKKQLEKLSLTLASSILRKRSNLCSNDKAYQILEWRNLQIQTKTTF